MAVSYFCTKCSKTYGDIQHSRTHTHTLHRDNVSWGISDTIYILSISSTRVVRLISNAHVMLISDTVHIHRENLQGKATTNTHTTRLFTFYHNPPQQQASVFAGSLSPMIPSVSGVASTEYNTPYLQRLLFQILQSQVFWGTDKCTACSINCPRSVQKYAPKCFLTRDVPPDYRMEW